MRIQKIAIAAALAAFLLPSASRAQGYEGVISAGEGSGALYSSQDQDGGYEGVLTWDDQSGNYDYTDADANSDIYSFIDSSDVQTPEQRRLRAQERVREENLRASEEARRAYDEAAKKRQEEQQAALDKVMENNRKILEEATKQEKLRADQRRGGR